MDERQSIDSIVEEPAHRTLRERAKDYSSTWKEYFRTLAPAIAISSVGSAIGQAVATHLGADSITANTLAAYVCGYIPGYTYYFRQEYKNHRERYPNGIKSKEFATYVGTFFAADWVSDILTFTPTFIGTNLLLMRHTNVSPFMRGIIAWDGAALLYISSMSALHPFTQRLTDSANAGIRRLYRAVRNTNSVPPAAGC